MKRTGRTIFFDVYGVKWTQVAVHLSADNHWSYQVYKQGIKQGKMTRIKFNDLLKVLDVEPRGAAYIKSFFHLEA